MTPTEEAKLKTRECRLWGEVWDLVWQHLDDPNTATRFFISGEDAGSIAAEACHAAAAEYRKTQE